MDLIFVSLLIIGCIMLSMLQVFSDRKGIIYAVLIAVLGVVMVVSNKWSVIPDIWAYVDNFSGINLYSSFDNVSPNTYALEKGFMSLTFLIKSICNNKAFYLSSVFLINLVCVLLGGYVLFGKDKPKMYCSALFISLWIGYFGILYGMAVLRAGLSISMAFLGYAFMSKKAYIRAALMFMCAFMMQSFIIIFIMAALLTFRYVRDRNAYWVWLIGCVALGLSRLSYSIASFVNTFSIVLSHYVPRFEKFSQFYNEISPDGFYSKKNILYLLLAVLFIYYKPDDDKQYDKMLNIYMVGLTVTYLINSILLCFRISDMFFVFCVPLAYRLITNNNKIDTASRVVMMIALIAVPFVISLRVTGIY